MNFLAFSFLRSCLWSLTIFLKNEFELLIGEKYIINRLNPVIVRLNYCRFAASCFKKRLILWWRRWLRAISKHISCLFLFSIHLLCLWSLAGLRRDIRRSFFLLWIKRRLILHDGLIIMGIVLRNSFINWFIVSLTIVSLT